MGTKEAPRWKKALVNAAITGVTSVVAPSAMDHIQHPAIVHAQGQGPFDPDDQRRHTRPVSELAPYERPDDDDKARDAMATAFAIGIVGTFAGAVYLLRRASRD